MTIQHSFAHDPSAERHSASPAHDLAAVPMGPDARERLSAWMAGQIALKRSEAHRLLESLIESGQLAHHRAEFVAAVKALAAGPKSWNAMGYRLLPDD